MTSTSTHGSAVRVFLTTLAAVLLMQTAWALVVPPFRGIDEHDHAYKAAAVARGDWSADHETSPSGREFLAVPRDLVDAATPVCESWAYTDPDNCRPQGDAGDGLIWVSSSAGRYNPIAYFFIGTGARAFDGTTALYAMRGASALLSGVLIALAAVAVRRWARTPWPAVAFVLTATPTMLYSTMVAAPNGLEVAGAVLVWSALLGLVSMPEDRRWFLAMATIGALPLVAVRSLGPLWCLLIVVTIGLFLGLGGVRALLRRPVTWVCAGVVAVATAAGVAWTLTAGTNAPGPPDPMADSYPTVWRFLPNEMLLWVLQSIGAFPSRDDPAPSGVYALVLFAWAVLTFLAWRAARRSERLILAWVVAVSAAVPLAATIVTYESIGTAWQGRYGYPFTMGFLLICGLVLDRTRQPAPRWIVWAAAALLTTAETIGQLALLADERVGSPLAGTDAWPTPSPLLVVALQAAACAVLAYAGARMRSPAPAAAKTTVDTLRP